MQIIFFVGSQAKLSPVLRANHFLRRGWIGSGNRGCNGLSSSREMGTETLLDVAPQVRASAEEGWVACNDSQVTKPTETSGVASIRTCGRFLSFWPAARSGACGWLTGCRDM